MVHRSLTGISGSGIKLYAVRKRFLRPRTQLQEPTLERRTSHLKPFTGSSCVVAILERATRALGGGGDKKILCVAASKGKFCKHSEQGVALAMSWGCPEF